MTRRTAPLPNQPSLFAAAAARDAALSAVDDAADPDWRDLALAAVRRTCELLPDFISDDIWTSGNLTSTREDRALGPVLLAAARTGWCRKTDRVRPSIRSHLSGKSVWVSLIYRGDERRQA